MYEYRMVQIPAAALAEAITHKDGCAKYLQTLANFGIEKGWEFYRIDTLVVMPTHVNVITFRRALPPHAAVPVNHHVAAEPEPEIVFDPVEAEPAAEEKPWWR